MSGTASNTPPRRPARSGLRLPEVYLIGAPKAGTTSLAHWLAEHPDIYFSVPKEPYYWADDFPRLRDHYGSGNRPAYEALFASETAQSATLRAEGSTVYLYSTQALRNIISEVENAKFLLLVRNPVDLLISCHRTQLVALNENERDFLTAWRRSLTGVLPTTDPLDAKLVDYPLIGALGQAVAKVLDVVPREQLHVIAFDDLRRNPESMWADLTRFLDVPAGPTPSFATFNPSNKMYRSERARRITHRPPAVISTPMTHLRQWSRTTRLPGVAWAKQQMWRPEQRPAVSAKAKAEVADYFRADVRLLKELVSVDVSEAG